MYFAPAFVAASNDFFSRKVSSPSSTTTSCRRNSRASRAASSIHARAQRSDVNIGLAQHRFGGLAAAPSPAGLRRWQTQCPEPAGPPSDSDKPVVPPAAQNRVLRPQRAMRELKRRARVVIEPAHQAVVRLETQHQRPSGFPAPPQNVCGKARPRTALMRGSVSMIG